MVVNLPILSYKFKMLKCCKIVRLLTVKLKQYGLTLQEVQKPKKLSDVLEDPVNIYLKYLPTSDSDFMRQGWLLAPHGHGALVLAGVLRLGDADV